MTRILFGGTFCIREKEVQIQTVSSRHNQGSPVWGLSMLLSTICASPTKIPLALALLTYTRAHNAPGPYLLHSFILRTRVFNLQWGKNNFAGCSPSFEIFKPWEWMKLKFLRFFFLGSFSFFFPTLFSFCKLAAFSKPATHKQSETLKCLLCFYQQTLFGIT